MFIADLSTVGFEGNDISQRRLIPSSLKAHTMQKRQQVCMLVAVMRYHGVSGNCACAPGICSSRMLKDLTWLAGSASLLWPTLEAGGTVTEEICGGTAQAM